MPVSSSEAHLLPAHHYKLQSPLPGTGPLSNGHSAGAAPFYSEEGEALAGGSGAQQSLADRFAAAGEQEDGQQLAAAEQPEAPWPAEQPEAELPAEQPGAERPVEQPSQPSDGWEEEEPPPHAQDSWAGEPLSPAALAAAAAAEHAVAPRPPSDGWDEEPPPHAEHSWQGEPMSPVAAAAAMHEASRMADEEPPIHAEHSWQGEPQHWPAEAGAPAGEQPAAPLMAADEAAAEAEAAAAAGEGWGQLDEELWEPLAEEQQASGQQQQSAEEAAAAQAAQGPAEEVPPVDSYLAAEAVGVPAEAGTQEQLTAGTAPAADEAAEGWGDGWGGEGLEELLPPPSQPLAAEAQLQAEQAEQPSEFQPEAPAGEWAVAAGAPFEPAPEQPLQGGEAPAEAAAAAATALSAAVNATAVAAAETAAVQSQELVELQQQVEALTRRCQEHQLALEAQRAESEEQLAMLREQLAEAAAAAAAAASAAADGEQRQLLGAAAEQDALKQVGRCVLGHNTPFKELLAQSCVLALDCICHRCAYENLRNRPKCHAHVGAGCSRRRPGEEGGRGSGTAGRAGWA